MNTNQNMNGSGPGQPPYGAPYPPYYPPQPKKPEFDYKMRHSVIAVTAFIVGYLFVKWMVGGATSAFIFVLLFSLLSLGLMAYIYVSEKRKPSFPAVALPVLNASLSAVYLYVGNDTVCELLALYEVLSYLLWYLFVIAYRDETKIGDGIFYDAVKAVFVMPFGSLFRIFPAVIAPLKNKKSGKKAAYILGGIAVAIIPTAIVIFLLASADTAFGNMMSEIGRALFGDDLGELILNIFLLFVSIPVSMYIFGTAFSSAERLFPEAYSEDEKKKKAEAASRVPVLLICSALIPLCIVYVIFFISQLGYYTSAFAGIVPEGYTVAEYARSGFFQLCAVAAINLAAITAASVFSVKNGSQSKPIRVMNVIISIMTLALIATAVRKIVLYIGIYGFTRLRVMTTWFMVLLAFIFIFILIRQFRRGFKLIPASLTAFAIMFSLLCFSNVDARIAQANVYMYENGMIENCDINAFYDLSPSAAEYVIPLLDSDDKKLADAAKKYLKCTAAVISDRENDWRREIPSEKRILGMINDALDKK